MMIPDINEKACWRLAVLDCRPYGYPVEGHALFILMEEKTTAELAERLGGYSWNYSYRSTQRAITELRRKGLIVKVRHGVYQADLEKIKARVLEIQEVA